MHGDPLVGRRIEKRNGHVQGPGRVG
jgi:hypothetical protein